jgi:catechol 2,3-dioxygenase-like lactoylglutathione lyase family enzyme
MVSAGVLCERTPQLNETYNVYHAFYRDPDGFLIEIQRFLDPRWPTVG